MPPRTFSTTSRLNASEYARFTPELATFGASTGCRRATESAIIITALESGNSRGGDRPYASGRAGTGEGGGCAPLSISGLLSRGPLFRYAMYAAARENDRCAPVSLSISDTTVAISGFSAAKI